MTWRAGVETVDTNVPKNEITVKGSMDVNEFTRYLNEKLKTIVVPQKKEDGGYKKDNEGSAVAAAEPVVRNRRKAMALMKKS